MKVALVHDFLLKLGGAERVLKVFADMFPDAPIHTLLYDEKSVGDVFSSDRVVTSKLQNYPGFIKKRYKIFTHKMPQAIEEFDFSGYDLVLSSSSAYSHGVVVPSNVTHICYCHSPMRYAWDHASEYIEENHISGFKRIVYSVLMKQLREWDRLSADRPDKYLANSKTVADRLKKYYRLDSDVLYPPVDVKRFSNEGEKGDYFLIVSTLTPYKRIDLAVELFNKIGRKLVIVGDGSHRSYLESIAASNIEFKGFLSDEKVKNLMENCRALLFPGEDDFGIVPVEAMACGKPVLAFGKGGALETVVPGMTGEFFYEPNLVSIEDGLARLIYNEKFYKPNKIREHAMKFDQSIFEKNIKDFIQKTREILV